MNSRTLSGKIAIVTGASRGIGKAIAIKLALEGAKVVINYLANDTEAKNVLEEIIGQNGEAILYKTDITDADNVREMTRQVIKQFGKIDILVNNAGIRKDTLLMWMENPQWQDVLNTNLNGFFYVTRILLKNMLVKKYGRIINVVSLSGLKGLPGQVNYSAAKAGVIGATKALAQEIGKKNVTVNAVAPGFIKTDMTKDLDENELKNLIPLNRFGTPEEVAEVVGFLASEKASYITGEVISVNGGLYT